jgi:hypothetical protein
VIYSYDVTAKGKEIANGLTVAVPLTPVWSQMTISEYNSFVDKYNGYASDSNAKLLKSFGNDAAKTQASDLYVYTLNKLTDKDNSNADTGEYLNKNEGNPFGYLHSWSDGAGLKAEELGGSYDSSGNFTPASSIPLAYNQGSATMEATKGSTDTNSYQVTCGFHVGISAGVKFDAVVAEGSVKGYFTFDYNRGYSEYHTHVDITDVSGTVNNVDPHRSGSAGTEQQDDKVISVQMGIRPLEREPRRGQGRKQQRLRLRLHGFGRICSAQERNKSGAQIRYHCQHAQAFMD